MKFLHMDSVRFIPSEERWQEPKDNIIRDGRDEYFVSSIGRACEEPECDEVNCDRHSERDLSSIRITRNRETQTFTLYISGESVLQVDWVDTPSGRGPNGHCKRLQMVKMFAKGWMGAEEEIPIKDVHLHAQGERDGD